MTTEAEPTRRLPPLRDPFTYEAVLQVVPVEGPALVEAAMATKLAEAIFRIEPAVRVVRMTLERGRVTFHCAIPDFAADGTDAGEAFKRRQRERERIWTTVTKAACHAMGVAVVPWRFGGVELVRSKVYVDSLSADSGD